MHQKERKRSKLHYFKIQFVSYKRKHIAIRPTGKSVMGCLEVLEVEVT